MKDSRLRKPVGGETVHPLPRETVLLAAPTQRAQPNAFHMIVECRQGPIDRFRDDRYLYSPRGVPYTDTSLRARWLRWLRKTPQGKELCTIWL